MRSHGGEDLKYEDDQDKESRSHHAANKHQNNISLFGGVHRLPFALVLPIVIVTVVMVMGMPRRSSARSVSVTMIAVLLRVIVLSLCVYHACTSTCQIMKSLSIVL